MSYTQATVIIKAEDQTAAQLDFPGSFVSAYYELVPDADFELATHYTCSGLWNSSDLDKVVNEVLWNKVVKFNDVQSVLQELNLMQVGQQPAPQPAAEDVVVQAE